MTSGTVVPGPLAADLAQAFDQAFAAPERTRAESLESFIAIGVSGETLAVRTADITGVARLTRVVPVPGSAPGLLGITAVHGTLYPVYDLAMLLALPAGNDPSWILLAHRETPVALGFDEFKGRVEIDRASVCESTVPGSRQHFRAVARLGTADRPVVDLPGVVEEIRKRAGLIQPAKEAQ